MTTSVLLLGHSFVKRLHQWCASNHKHNFNLSTNRIHIYWHGVSGGILLPTNKTKFLSQATYLVSELKIDVTFVEAGSNNLHDLSLSVEDIVKSLFDLADTILNSGGRLVILAEILPRHNEPMYNKRVCRANALISARCQLSRKLFLWTHSRNNFNLRFTESFVADDVVHVHPTLGMPQYYMSVHCVLCYLQNADFQCQMKTHQNSVLILFLYSGVHLYQEIMVTYFQINLGGHLLDSLTASVLKCAYQVLISLYISWYLEYFHCNLSGRLHKGKLFQFTIS
ncbi:hypothetical protein DPMN_132837 [Dreissena polymorpha]|uniref:Uncharacterized protein n=1 Tax=Dreissena polymorpha TaxID=45954 RepID=A0A9D4FT64_DREPO|nr:hypothetical protein DPMN_132837 [Dreissena polymorpha]